MPNKPPDRPIHDLLEDFRIHIDAPAEFLIQANAAGEFSLLYSNSHSKLFLGMPLVATGDPPVAWDQIPDILADYLRRVFQDLGVSEEETSLPILELHEPAHCAFSVKLQQRIINTGEAKTHYFFFALNDVTSWLSLQEEVMSARRLESLGSLAAGVAHDFNNIIMVIRGNLEFLQSIPHEQRTEDLLKEICEQIQTACANGTHMTSSLLGFARKQSLAMEPMDLRQLIKETCDLAKISYGTRYPIHVDPALLSCESSTENYKIEGCQSALSQCLLNILNNARDAMPDGGIIHIEPAMDHNHFGFTVVDEGPGMPANVLKQVFDPFFTTKQKGSGTGLGLSMAREIMKQHQGKMEVDSRQGRGTRVFFLWPTWKRLETSIEPQIQEVAIPPKKLSSALRTSKLMPLAYVVDDDTMVLKPVAQMLNKLGFRTETFSKPEEALKSLREGSKPALILVDYNMPGIDGISFMRQAYQIMKGFFSHAYSKIILVSGHPPDYFHEFVREFHGAPFYMLAKPFGMEELSRVINRENKRRARRTTSQFRVPAQHLPPNE